MKRVAEILAKEYNLTKKESKDVVDTVVAAIAEVVQSGEKIRLNDLGTFSVKEKSARTARNPKTGETINVPAKRVVKFQVAKSLKESV